MKSYLHPALHLVSTLLCAAGLLTFSATAQAPSDVRIALIIGNSAYPGNMALANPSNDAKDMAATLRNMGFGVVEVLDGNRAQMLEAIDRAGRSLSGKQGVGMLFYAGHGLQLDWRNYMVPVDAKLASAKDVPTNTVDIEAVMTAFKDAGNRMNIVVLDACRDNPFADGKTASGKGLAPLDAPTGTFLAYATAPGNVAQDGTGKNGLYTGYLLEELQKPTAKIEEVFKRVRFNVRKASNGAQIPWETTSLEDEFVFNSGIKKAVKLSDSEKDKQFEIEKAEWDKIKDSKSADPFYAFVQKYPTGLLASAAQGAIDRLNAAKVQAYTDKNGTVQGQTTGRFLVGDAVQYVRTDGITKIETKRTVRIAEISNGQAITDTGTTYATLQGEWVGLDVRAGEYQPARRYLPSDKLAVGEKWHGVSRYPDWSGNPAPMRDEAKVVAFESVTTKAGTFMAYKIDMDSTTVISSRSIASARFAYRIKQTYWVTPSLGLPIKMQYAVQGASIGFLDRWTEEAVSIKRGS